MKNFLLEIRTRNETLFYFGLVCFIASALFWALTKTSNIHVCGVNAWFKPLKFAISTFLFVWAMAWYCHYLVNFQVVFYNWTVILLLGFEIVYIAWMAGNGDISHYNQRTPIYSFLFSLMAIAATVVTLYTGYIGIIFFVQPFPNLPDYYVWAIRLSLFIFVVFAFEGFVMGAKLSHSVGLVNDNSDMYVVGWSKKVGDLRIAHFIGMHALQVLPILSYYLLKNTKFTFLLSFFYGFLALVTLIHALNGKPIVTLKINQNATNNERKE